MPVTTHELRKMLKQNLNAQKHMIQLTVLMLLLQLIVVTTLWYLCEENVQAWVWYELVGCSCIVSTLMWCRCTVVMFGGSTFFVLYILYFTAEGNCGIAGPSCVCVCVCVCVCERESESEPTSITDGLSAYFLIFLLAPFFLWPPLSCLIFKKIIFVSMRLPCVRLHLKVLSNHFLS